MLEVKPLNFMDTMFSFLTSEMALNALVLPSFSPPLDTVSAECIAALVASSTPSLIFLPMSVRLTSSRLFSMKSTQTHKL